jgi:DnaJ-domain-containing protein 1
MASKHTVADDIVYDLISIQYHSLKAAQVYDKFLDDAHSSEHEDVAEFITLCKQQDEQRAIRCHEFLGQLTRSGIG